jgi:PPOX class probable F420-dependent enzyme
VDARLELFDSTNLVYLSTLMPDGSPQVTPLWVELRDDEFLINTAEHRLKTRNMRRDPRVALAVHDATNPYRYVTVRGRVTSITTDGAAELNDRLAQKYMGVETFPFDTSGQTRVVVTIAPENVYVYGPDQHPRREQQPR